MGDAWLAAYEAQKAKAMEKISSNSGTTDQHKSLAGSSGYSGLVDANEVRHLSRSTQVTKIMDKLKRTDQKPSKPPQNLQKPSQTTISTSETLNTPCNPRNSTSPSFENHPDPTKTCASNKSHSKPSSAGQSAISTIKNHSEPFNSGFCANKQNTVDSNGVPIPQNHPKPPETAKKGSVAKKRVSDEPSVADLMKRVKKDAKKSSEDWQVLYERRKRNRLENNESKNEDTEEIIHSEVEGESKPEVRKVDLNPAAPVAFVPPLPPHLINKHL